MIINLLIYWVSSTVDISKILVGSWNISKFIISSDGNEVPEINRKFSLNLSFNNEENFIYGNLSTYSMTGNNSEYILIQFDPTLDSNSTFSIKIDALNDSQEFSELTLLKINVGIDDMIIATGSANNITYSLNIVAPTYAELKTFNQEIKQLVLYRFSKKFYRRLSFQHLLPFITTFIYTTIKFLIE